MPIISLYTVFCFAIYNKPLIDVTDASHQGLSYRIIIAVLRDYVIVYILSLSCLFIIHLLDYARAVMF